MNKIKTIAAQEIKDSRGNPTIKVILNTEKGDFTASVPSGASKGSREALELRDSDGRGVKQAIKNIVEVIAPELKGKEVDRQKEIDEKLISLDGTENKKRLGANAILGVSLAVCRAGAFTKKIPLYQYIAQLANNKNKLFCPFPMFNFIEGGKHAKNQLAIQEFLVIPQKDSFHENFILGNKIYSYLKEAIEKNYKKLEMGDEGGIAPPFYKIEQALFLLENSIKNFKDTKTKIGLDCAASEFYKDGKYNLEGKEILRTELLEFYFNLTERFSIGLIEDPFHQDDWNGFQDIMRRLGERIIIVGDDLTTTNIKRIKEAYNKKACNGIILKLNQIGTVSETIEASQLAKSFGWKTIVSHRSGETMDDFIADLAVGLGADFIKSGCPSQPERMVKYQRLLAIESELNKR